MVDYFLIGIALGISIYIFRFITIYSLSKLFRESIKDNVYFNLRDTIIEVLFWGILFAVFHIATEKVSSDTLYISIYIFFMSLIPTYFYIIQPLHSLIGKEVDKENFKFLQNIPELDNYNIKIIDKEITNAYASGILPFSKTILIGKPLLSGMSEQELKSLIFHEIGHLKLNHLLKLYVIVLMVTIVSGFLFFFRNGYSNVLPPYLDYITVFMVGCIMGFLLWYVPGKIQYTFELQADKFAANLNGNENMINALKKLDELSNGDVTKGGLTHPTLIVRISNILKK